ncbi:MAG: hypothetical protein MJA84_08960 [Firmicutes bacterium]|nr:hypothetical protein [Bacillota bacterium]
MKKHKSYQPSRIGERMCDEFNEAKSFRETVFIAHLYIEYYINEILVKIFPHPEKIIDENELGTFKNKMQLLDALGIFEGKENLKNNVILIQRIRNYYAHNISISDEFPDQIVNRIKQMVYMNRDGSPDEYDVPWEDQIDAFDAQFSICALETTNHLVWLEDELETLNPKKK